MERGKNSDSLKLINTLHGEGYTMIRSTEQAKRGLTFLILINVLIHLFQNDFREHINLNKTFRINNGDLSSMLLSIFFHMEPSHLIINMLSLHRYGSETFVHSSSKRWHSFFLVVASYLICGIGAFVGVELLSQYHEYQWEQSLQDARWKNRCTHWLCHKLNDATGLELSSIFTNLWSDWKTSFRFAEAKLSMFYFRSVHRIGASGVTYGWMGMRLVTSWMSPYHSRLNGMDYFFLLVALSHDLSKIALSLKDLKMSIFLEEDNVDHSAHLMGFMFGMIWAIILVTWERVPSMRWRGDGSRLGARWEEEEQRQHQDQQRRELSRLIN